MAEKKKAQSVVLKKGNSARVERSMAKMSKKDMAQAFSGFEAAVSKNAKKKKK